MCGRVHLSSDYSEIKIGLKLGEDAPATNARPNWNTAPTQDMLVVYLHPDTRQRVSEHMHFGLIPPWAKEPKMDYPTFNARADTITEKATFKGAWRAGRRCLIVTNGFYEWKKSKKNVKNKWPYAIARTNEKFTVMAGLWETWRGKETGETIRSCCIITTTANSLIEPLHDRMPVLLAEADWPKWLGEVPAHEEELKAMLRSYPSGDMTLWPVSRRVGNVKNNDPDLVKPVEIDER
jgi:putative SOS response-associated peptidase YedK